MTENTEKEYLEEAIKYAVNKIMELDEPKTDFDRMITKMEFVEHVKAHLREHSNIPEDLIKTMTIIEERAE